MKAKPFPDAFARILCDQQITETEPGPILHDFGVFLDFIAANHPVASPKNHLLPQACLVMLNERLAKPIEVRLKRAVQKSYPHINGLYLLARASGLMRVLQRGKEATLVLDNVAMDSWAELNDTERYFTLLEAWFRRASMEILGDSYGRKEAGMLSDCLDLWHRFREKGLKFGRADHKYLMMYWAHNIALMEMFGLVRIKRGKPQEEKGWIIDRIDATEFGAALMSLVARHHSVANLADEWEREDEEKGTGAVTFDWYLELLQPYFPELRNSLTLSSNREFRDGVYLFKVSLGKRWRRIAVPAKLTLYDLSDEILDAFEFDHDHLHMFEYKDRFGLKATIGHPDAEESPFTDDVKVGEMPLLPGEAMTYIFDFGDWWKFKVELETIDPPNPGMKHSKVLESHGKAPEQYRGWDDV